MPKRIQLKRTKGWRMPANTVKVDRTTKFGNPFKVGTITPRGLFIEDAEISVQQFRIWLGTSTAGAKMYEQARTELRGKDLACWCREGKTCHADVLLEIANEVAA